MIFMDFQTDKIKKGFVYVISTAKYYKQDIFKIGFANCIKKRLLQFNNTRTSDDQFTVYLQYETIKYQKLEYLTHQALSKHRLKNELFNVPLITIQETINNIICTGMFNHHDILFDIVQSHNICFTNNTWAITNPPSTNDDTKCTIFMNDSEIIHLIRLWLQPYDKYNLYKFISDDYYISLLSFLKSLIKKQFPEINMLQCITLELTQLKLSEQSKRKFVKAKKSIRT